MAGVAGCRVCLWSILSELCVGVVFLDLTLFWFGLIVVCGFVACVMVVSRGFAGFDVWDWLVS